MVDFVSSRVTAEQFERMLHRKRGNNNKNIPKSSASSESISNSIKNKRDVTHGTCSVANDNSTLEKLDVRGDDGSADISDVSSGSEFVLTGLHACGDLTPTLLRLFAESNDCVGVAAVGCCYMRMKSRFDLDHVNISSNASSHCASFKQHPHTICCSEAQSAGGHPTSSSPPCDVTINNQHQEWQSFPMSKRFESFKTSLRSYELFELACHSIDTYRTRLRGKAKTFPPLLE